MLGPVANAGATRIERPNERVEALANLAKQHRLQTNNKELQTNGVLILKCFFVHTTGKPSRSSTYDRSVECCMSTRDRSTTV